MRYMFRYSEARLVLIALQVLLIYYSLSTGEQHGRLQRPLTQHEIFKNSKSFPSQNQHRQNLTGISKRLGTGALPPAKFDFNFSIPLASAVMGVGLIFLKEISVAIRTWLLIPFILPPLLVVAIAVIFVPENLFTEIVPALFG